MNARSQLATLNQLVRDTFRQAYASGICGIMLAVTSICVALCLSVTVKGDVSLHGGDETHYFLPSPGGFASTTAASGQVWSSLKTDPEHARREGVDTVSGRLTLAFGAISFPISRERRDAVHFLELILAGGVAGTLGLLLALVWTAGFVPAFLDPGAASVLLAKPVARWELLLGKYLGVLTFVGVQVALFVGLTWLGLGIRTRVWDTTYLWSIPLLLLQFAIFYSFSIFLAVVTRSTAACVFGAVLYWLLAWGINYGSAMAGGLAEPQALPASTITLARVAYWVFPKPIDAQLIVFNALGAYQHFEKPQLFTLLETAPFFSVPLSLLSSLALTAVLLALAAHEFEATDY